jgi:hypothetical protein
LQVSLNDGLFGVGSPVVAAVDLVALQPILTFQDLPDALHKYNFSLFWTADVSFLTLCQRPRSLPRARVCQL